MNRFINRVAHHSVYWWLISLLGLLPTSSNAWCRGNDATEPPPIFVFLIDVSGSMNDQIPLSIQPNLTKESKLTEIKNRLAKLCAELPDGYRVLVSVFDHERREVCDITLRGKDDRSRLSQAIARIKSNDGSTWLWRSVDEELMRATKLVASTSQRARVVIYSDGEDMEKNANLNYKTVLDKHGLLIQKSLNLDWVTLGYDLTPAIKTDFEKAGANVVRAVSVDQLIPLSSAFVLSRNTIEVGDSVTISDRSSGIQITKQYLDFGDGTPAQELPLSSGRFPDVSHVFAKPGSYVVKLSTETKNAQRNSFQGTIKVTNKAWNLPAIRTDTKHPLLNSPITFSIDPPHNDLKLEWQFSDGTSYQGAKINWIPREPGRYTVELVATDATGQTKKQQRAFTVPNPEIPKLNIIVSDSSVEVGNSILLKADPVDPSLKYEWIVDNEAHGTGPVSHTKMDKVGTRDIRLMVHDSYGQSASATAQVTVRPPSPPKAVFRLASGKLEPGQRIIALNESPKTASGFVWNLNGREISNARNLEYEVPTYGEYKLELIAKNEFGQSDTRVESVVVPLPPPPQAGFTVGSKQIRLGDPVFVTHTCSGKIDSIKYEFGDRPSVELKYPVDADRSTIETAPSQAGKFSIKQTVIGPGGISSAKNEVEVIARWKEPIANIHIDNRCGRERLEVRLVNKSEGDVSKCELDAGDGSPIQSVEGAKDLVHTYGPGNWYPTVTVYGPPNAGLPPSVWKGEKIVVSNPTPVWIKNLVWQLPIMGLVTLGGFGLSRYWSRRLYRIKSMRLSGHLEVRPLDDPLTVFEFELDEPQSQAVVSLPNDTVIKIVNRSTGMMELDEFRPFEYGIDIENVNNATHWSGRLKEDEEAVIGSFALTFSR